MSEPSPITNPPADVLRRAADLITPAGAWTQNRYKRDRFGNSPTDPAEAVSFCAVGAIAKAWGVSDDYAHGWVNDFFTSGWSLGAYNDAGGRRQDEVVAKLREIADRLDGGRGE